MAFLVATTSLPAVYRLNGYAQTATAGMPHARAKILISSFQGNLVKWYTWFEPNFSI